MYTPTYTEVLSKFRAILSGNLMSNAQFTQISRHTCNEWGIIETVKLELLEYATASKSHLEVWG